MFRFILIFDVFCCKFLVFSQRRVERGLFQALGRGNYNKYTPDQMAAALRDVWSGYCTVYKAAKVHRVPRQTLDYYLKGKVKPETIYKKFGFQM